MSKLLKPVKLVVIASEAGRVTRKYPFEEPLVTPDFRGKIEINASKCIGCGACVNACPPNALQLIEDKEKLVLRYFIGRCIFCWRCIDVCPTGAIKGTREFELATDDISDLYTHVVHSRKVCASCGNTYATEKIIRYVAEHASLSEEYLDKCPDCRKRNFIKALSRRRGGFE
ncbi:4Fe-4S dicluster domain-containing protein [Desulfurococcus amylolyticus]|uniref:4Fe-4S dicluster domain-containing protein n=1 Tax=Desulfurococcus amylolyticus TaxID=94694 RepID=UPI0005B223BD|nr:4Fe-4S dicluster domain-containing protein [Desulfurococcus amylolyticus]